MEMDSLRNIAQRNTLLARQDTEIQRGYPAAALNESYDQVRSDRRF
jgi:hypothetical protein